MRACLAWPDRTPLCSAAGSELGRDMHLLTVTSYYPNSVDRERAVFVQNLVQHVSGRRSVSVIAPVPYAPPFLPSPRWSSLRRIATREQLAGIDVQHPRYLVLPRTPAPSGLFYGLGVVRAIQRSHRVAGPMVVHVHCAYPDAVGAALASRFLGLSYVVTVHGSDINQDADSPSLRPQIAWALRGSAGIIAVSRALESKVGALLAQAKVPVRVIPCAGFDPEVFFPRSKAPLRQDLGMGDAGRVVVFVGQLVAIKNVACLIDAWSRLRTGGRIRAADRLVIIGDGPLRSALEGQAAASGATVHFTGQIPQRVVSHWVGAADALCLPSRNEGTPNVLVEALASGVPVVASAVGGIPEIVSDGVNGVLVAPGDVDQLARALSRCLDSRWDIGAVRSSIAHLRWASIALENVAFIDSVTKRVAHDAMV